MQLVEGSKSIYFPEKNIDDNSGPAHRQLVGYIGLFLAPTLWIIAGLRPVLQGTPWKTLDSISAYYYSGGVSVFSGALFALAVFLFTYGGYENEGYLRDRIAAFIAAYAAIIVAVFPTAPPPGYPTPPWWTPESGWIHQIAAVILFAAFIFIAFLQFPRTGKHDNQKPDRDKEIRNRIYKFCAVAMTVCVIWALINAQVLKTSIFWPEALALEFFAISWLVKGKIDFTAKVAGAKAIDLIRNMSGGGGKQK